MNIIQPVFAAPTTVPLGNIACGGGLGPFADFICRLSPNEPENPVKVITATAGFISNIIAILITVAGIWFIIQFIIGGFGWLSSSGDKARLEKAQQTLLNAVIGLVIVLASYALISLVAKILGFDILLTDPRGFVERLGTPTPTP